MTTHIEIPDTHDYEGIDDWIVMAFDNFGDTSSDEMEEDGKTQHGTFAQCVQKAAEWISEHNMVQYRIVIERVM